MSRTTRSAKKGTQLAAQSSSTAKSSTVKSRSATANKSNTSIKRDANGVSPQKTTAGSKRTRSSTTAHETPKKVKLESEVDRSCSSEPSPTTQRKDGKGKDLQAKKLQAYAEYANKSPFSDFAHPTAAECKLAHRILASLHGPRTRPKEVVAPSSRAGCGDSPSVLDALVRTILSQNTSDTNSTRAKRSMDQVYGGSDKWDAIVAGGQAKLQEAIKCGGLSVTKSKVITSILEQAKEKYGEYSLDHLHEASNEDAMNEMLSFQGVGPKTASCVLLFCLRRESFAVDTHVWRITGLLGWRPKTASRDETHAHLDAMIPDEDKYGLHILLVTHGKRCDECRAGGKSVGKCELRKAFAKGKLKGDAGEDVKQETSENMDEKEQKAMKKEHSVKAEPSMKEEKPSPAKRAKKPAVKEESSSES